MGRFHQKYGTSGAGSRANKGKGSPSKKPVEQHESVKSGIQISAAEVSAIYKVIFRGNPGYQSVLGEIRSQLKAGDTKLIRQYCGIIGHALRFYRLKPDTRIAFEGLFKKLQAAQKSR